MLRWKIHQQLKYTNVLEKLLTQDKLGNKIMQNFDAFTTSSSEL